MQAESASKWRAVRSNGLWSDHHGDDFAQVRCVLAGTIRVTVPVLVALMSVACTREQVVRLAAKTYQAHGLTWTYRRSEIRSTNPWLASLHAGGNRYRERHLIEKESGEQIAVEDRLYALQRNGQYKRVRCCEYFREQGELYNFDGRLVFQFENARTFITDCYIYPAGLPDNERKAREHQVFGSRVYAVFDPTRQIFLVDMFDAGRRDSRMSPAEEARQSIETAAYAAYRHRAPFNCKA